MSGGAIAHRGGILIALTRMTRIIEVDVPNRLAVVEAGVVNLNLSNAVSKYGLYFAPDPSSQRACTIGGNVAENSGGPHCLAYGVTTNHVLGMEVVLADGSVNWVGANTRESAGYDLRGVLIGSEGTLAIASKIVVRLLRLPEAVKTLLAVFREIDDASRAVSGINCRRHYSRRARNDGPALPTGGRGFRACGLSEGAGAVLLVEVDGLEESVEEEVEEIRQICQGYDPIEIRTAEDEKEREQLWAGRKGVLGALGRLAPNYYLVDGTIPRTKLVEVLSKVREFSEESGLPIANVLHAGDGNLHPCILFDERKPGADAARPGRWGAILELCVNVGGVLSGEHGIGLEKQQYMPLMFGPGDMEAMRKLQPAFDTNDMLNPGKIFPTGAPERRWARPLPWLRQARAPIYRTRQSAFNDCVRLTIDPRDY